ncbi:MAG: ABC transporter permease [Thermoplasmata archaeon]|nr:ABC transporter permease [Thermoplasmata archaeon]
MSFGENFRTFRFAAWLGWQADSNWTDPYLFSIYSIIRPLAGTMLIVIMYWFVGAPQSVFYYMFIGSAFFMYVFNVMIGVSWIIHEDREHYQTLKYLYISPANFYLYMFGRSVSRVLITTVAVIITLLFGVFALGVQIDAGQIDYPMLFLVLAIGLVGIAAFGVALSGIALITARHSGRMHEALAGFFYLFCGVIFPISVLPGWGQSIAMALPTTYWLELVRRSMIGYGDPTLAGMDFSSILIILIVSTIVFLLFSILIFKMGEHIAKKNGLLDMTTAY